MAMAWPMGSMRGVARVFEAFIAASRCGLRLSMEQREVKQEVTTLVGGTRSERTAGRTLHDGASLNAKLADASSETKE